MNRWITMFSLGAVLALLTAGDRTPVRFLDPTPKQVAREKETRTPVPTGTIEDRLAELERRMGPPMSDTVHNLEKTVSRLESRVRELEREVVNLGQQMRLRR